MQEDTSSTALSELVHRGGVYYNLAGREPKKIIEGAARMVRLSTWLDRAILAEALLERESLMSTAIGDGVAIPHTRMPIFTDAEEARVAVFFLEYPVDWGALDEKPVQVVFLILSSDLRTHLSTLSAISHLSHEDGFSEFLAGRPSTEELVEFIASKEAGWRK